MKFEETEAIRTAFRSIPKAGAASVGSPPTVEEMYVLPAHSLAVDPDVSLVVGNRGMGKTFWATSLVDPVTRKAAMAALPPRPRAFHNEVEVVFGFSDREGVQGISADEIRSVANCRPESIWRGTIIHILSKRFGKQISFKNAVQLAEARPDDARQTLRRYDEILTRNKTKFLILFDQLDQLAETWPEIQSLTKGLLKTTLSMKSYRSVRLKVFMRTDQFSDRDLFEFADSSKVHGEATRLNWFSTDLYGLAYSWLWRDLAARQVLAPLLPLTELERNEAIASDKAPVCLRADPDVQAAVFDLLAGDQMGGGEKRGRPYSWIITHLMDGIGEISPRSFLHALTVAAERIPESNQGLAIDYGTIQAGVSSASDIRRRELFEDYPWIAEALEPLRGITVPVERSELKQKWQKERTPENILKLHKDARAPIELATAHNSSESRLKALERALEQIGVIQERDEARVNIPDIFRIAAGIKRKGGIRPQQRRQI
ncbi:hypothetical protein [Sphingomonas sp. Leaf22]|uniref:hypothetical protein n=1 Tax=Sphingomonas sp. Leaf22 TaxID=1735687 RepID=UPI000AD20432|nr:hypothetical protein [Sphingomonas sp. Leaf22]